MGYYVRVLSTSDECVPISTIRRALSKAKQDALLETEVGSETDWDQIVLKHENGPEIASIERNPVGVGSLGQEELQEFRDELKRCKPISAAEWLSVYFDRVKCIYAFQVLSGTEYKNGWDILGTVKSVIWNFAPSVFQADTEGFSNEEGYHILWQFSDSVSGTWWMSVIRNGRWVQFQMELSNPAHRESFLKGEPPIGVIAEEGEPC
jgi:hypothetical protein